MEIANALARADSQSLAAIGFELLGSLGEARAHLASYSAADEKERREEEAIAAARRQRDAARKRRVRGCPPDSDGIRETVADSPPFSPTPPFSSPASSSSSSARATVWNPADEAALARRLPSDAGRVALTTVLMRCGEKRAVAAEIRMILDGGRPNVSHRPEHMELALQDYAANGLTDGRFNAAHFRRHVQRAAQGEPPATTRRGGVGQRTYDNGREALKHVPE